MGEPKGKWVDVEPGSFGDWVLVHESTEFEVGAQIGPDVNFLKGVKWSPDGTCVLTASEDRLLRVFSIPQQTFISSVSDAPSAATSQLLSCLRAKEGEIVYDCCWFPLMSSLDPISACFVSSSRDHPIHLWDAFTGSLRCSFAPHNHLDELVSALSLSFSHDGSHLYSGFDGCIRTFDVTRPGRDCSVLPTSVKGDPSSSISGIVGSLAANREGTLLAAGSYSSKGTALYSIVDGSCVGVVTGHNGGVTHVQFSPDGAILATGARKDGSILCWDMKKMASPLYSLRRSVATNQRISFDFTPSGNALVTGSACDVLMFSMADGSLLRSVSGLHGDIVNSVSVHPSMPLLATGTGQRHHSVDFSSMLSSLRDSESDGDGDGDGSNVEGAELPTAMKPSQVDTRLRVFKVPFSWRD